MDGEKPLRVLGGKTLLQHAIDLMHPLVDEVIVCSGKRNFDLPDGISHASDAPEFAGKGPLAGVLAGLLAARFESALLLPCDCPFLGVQVLRHIKIALETNSCAYITLDGFPQPLVAGVHCKAARSPIRLALQAGSFRVSPIWKSLSGKELPLKVGDGVMQSEREFVNINTLDDLDSAAQS